MAFRLHWRCSKHLMMGLELTEKRLAGEAAQRSTIHQEMESGGTRTGESSSPPTAFHLPTLGLVFIPGTSTDKYDETDTDDEQLLLVVAAIVTYAVYTAQSATKKPVVSGKDV